MRRKTGASSIALVIFSAISCNRSEQPRARAFAAASEVHPARGAAPYRGSPQLTSIESSKTDPLDRPLRVACVTCHSQRQPERLPQSTAELDEFHVGLSFEHGGLTCASCHALGQELRLRLADNRTIPMADALALCSQCHGPQRRNYDRGAHGGMRGAWNRSLGERVRNQCVDCHDPHVPAYVGGTPVLPPRDRGVEQSRAQGTEHRHDG